MAINNPLHLELNSCLALHKQVTLTFFSTDIQFKWGQHRPPESVCSAECELGQAKQYVEGESCCWHCFNCTQYEVNIFFIAFSRENR